MTTVLDPRFSPRKGVAGAFVFILSESMFFLGLFFMWNFYAVVQGAWPPLNIPKPSPVLPLINSAVMACSVMAITLASRAIARDNRRVFVPTLIISCVLGLLFAAIQIVEFSRLSFGPTSNNFGSAFFFLLFFHVARVLAGVVFMMIVLSRALIGQFSSQYRTAVIACTMYWYFIAVVWYVVFYTLYLAWPTK